MQITNVIVRKTNTGMQKSQYFQIKIYNCLRDLILRYLAATCHLFSLAFGRYIGSPLVIQHR